MHLKRLLIGLAALGLLFAAGSVSAAPPANISYTVGVCDPNFPQQCWRAGSTKVTTTEKGGTVTSGGTAQAAIAANSLRRGWCIQNDPAATEVMTVRANGTASATTGVALQPGWQTCNQPEMVDTAAISVFAATTGHRWFGFEAQ